MRQGGLRNTAAFFITNPADLTDDLYRDSTKERRNLLKLPSRMASFGAQRCVPQPLLFPYWAHDLCPNVLCPRMKFLNPFGCIRTLGLAWLSEVPSRLVESNLRYAASDIVSTTSAFSEE